MTRTGTDRILEKEPIGSPSPDGIGNSHDHPHPAQRRALEKAGEQPVRIADPETRTEYVLLRADVYEKLRAMLGAEPIDPSFYEYGDFIPLKK